MPLTEAAYFEDDIITWLNRILTTLYGKEELAGNLQWLAESLGKIRSGESAEERIRRYFFDEFYKDHCRIYQKRPILLAGGFRPQERDTGPDLPSSLQPPHHGHLPLPLCAGATGEATSRGEVYRPALGPRLSPPREETGTGEKAGHPAGPPGRTDEVRPTTGGSDQPAREAGSRRWRPPKLLKAGASSGQNQIVSLMSSRRCSSFFTIWKIESCS